MAFRFGPRFASSIDANGKRWQTKFATTTTYRNGDPIPQVTNNTVWANLTTGAWCWYNNDPANEATYGKLYNWYAINDTRGIAPYGYRVPKLNPSEPAEYAGSDFVSSAGQYAWYFQKPGHQFPGPYVRTAFSGLRQPYGSFDLIEDTMFFGIANIANEELYFAFGGIAGDEIEIAGIDKNAGLTLWFIQE